MPVSVYTVLFAVAGLYHGSAYAGAIVGAETTPLLAYLIGFGLVQFAIMVAAGWAASRARAHVDRAALEPRLAGAVVAGVGLTFLVEHAERRARLESERLDACHHREQLVELRTGCRVERVQRWQAGQLADQLDPLRSAVRFYCDSMRTVQIGFVDAHQRRHAKVIHRAQRPLQVVDA